MQNNTVRGEWFLQDVGNGSCLARMECQECRAVKGRRITRQKSYGIYADNFLIIKACVNNNNTLLI